MRKEVFSLRTEREGRGIIRGGVKAYRCSGEKKANFNVFEKEKKSGKVHRGKKNLVNSIKGRGIPEGREFYLLAQWGVKSVGRRDVTLRSERGGGGFCKKKPYGVERTSPTRHPRRRGGGDSKGRKDLKTFSSSPFEKKKGKSPQEKDRGVEKSSTLGRNLPLFLQGGTVLTKGKGRRLFFSAVGNYSKTLQKGRFLVQDSVEN